jgi:hypothetical protein
MTMIQAVVTETRISVVADSICGSAGHILRGDDGHEIEECKLIALPHARCVLTSLGSLALRQRVQCSPGAITHFDQGIKRLPQLLARLYASLMLHLHEDDHPLGHSVLLMGWSAERQRMALAHFHSRTLFEPEVHGDPVNGGMVFWRCPDLPREKYLCLPIDTQELIAFAHTTVDHYRGIDPTTPIGGKLILAELTEQAVTISVAGDLGMPSQPASP